MLNELDDLDAEDIDNIISQTSQHSQANKHDQTAEQRLDQLESQPIDFVAAQKHALPSLKGSNLILSM